MAGVKAAGVVKEVEDGVKEIFGGVTGFGIGGVPPFGAFDCGAPATGDDAAPACGLFWK